MDVNEQERLSNFTIKHKLKYIVNERSFFFYCCSTFHSHSMVCNKEHNSYSNMSLKCPLACSSVALIINKPTHFDNRTGNYSLLDPILITDSISIIDSDTIHMDRV